MKKIVLLALLGVSLSINAMNNLNNELSDLTDVNVVNGERYICTVTGVSTWNGETITLKIYFRSESWTTDYIAREIMEDGRPNSVLSGTVERLSSQGKEHYGNYKYIVKTGMLRAFLFNTNKLNDKYIEEQ